MSEIVRTRIIDHRFGCTRPGTQEVVTRRGDVLRECTGCARYIVKKRAPKQETPQQPHSGPSPASLPAGARWVCRDHYRPVNWRGKGCHQCAGQQVKS